MEFIFDWASTLSRVRFKNRENDIAQQTACFEHLWKEMDSVFVYRRDVNIAVMKSRKVSIDIYHICLVILGYSC